jgi:hypothetical protein
MERTSDPAARLRLFRYGVIVVVVVTFIVTLIFPYSAAVGAGASITSFLGQAVIATIIAAVIGAVAYIAYAYVLTKKFPWAK